MLAGVTTNKKYSYNENDELIKTVTTQGNQTSTKQYIITLTGNKTEVTDGQVTYRAVYDDFNRISSYYDGKNHINYTYDARGNRITETRDDNKVRTYSYNIMNQITQVKDYDETTTAYSYDGAGNRIRQTINREKTSYADNTSTINKGMNTLIERLQLSQQKDSTSFVLPQSQEDSQQTNYSVIPTTQKVTQIDYLNDVSQENVEVLCKIQDEKTTLYWYGNNRIGANTDFHLTDGQGNVTVVLTGSNTVRTTYQYDDYGRRNQIYDPFSTASQEYGYRQEAHNPDETQYLRARYYDTATKLFLSADGYRGEWNDPISQNRYNYGRNNPNKYFDPKGNKSIAKPVYPFVLPKPKPKPAPQPAPTSRIGKSGVNHRGTATKPAAKQPIGKSIVNMGVNNILHVPSSSGSSAGNGAAKAAAQRQEQERQ